MAVVHEYMDHGHRRGHVLPFLRKRLGLIGTGFVGRIGHGGGRRRLGQSFLNGAVRRTFFVLQAVRVGKGLVHLGSLGFESLFELIARNGS